MSAWKILKHLFLPYHTNNQKPKILHSSSLLFIALILISFQIFVKYVSRSGVKILGYASQISIDEVVRITNEKRQQAGLDPLTLNPQLSQAARAKGDNMISADYWAHIAPDGTEPWKFFKDAGYNYRYAGENLARDFQNASSAVDAWMASPSHKENLLSTKYKEIGIAVVEGDLSGVDTTLIVQLFGTRLADTAPSLPVAAKPVSAATNVTPSPRAALSSPKPAIVQTPTPIAVTQVNVSSPPQAALAIAQPENLGNGNKLEYLISPFKTTKWISVAITGILIVTLLVDSIIIFRRRIIRIGGRSFAHISFLGMILIIMLILRSGRIF